MLKNKALILAKVETVYGTDPTPTGAANAILCGNVDYDVLENKLERNNIKSSFGALKFVAIGEGQKLSFEVELKGSGAAGTAPEISPLLRACGFTLTTNAGVSNVYTPNSAGSSAESVTIYYYIDGIMHAATGCRGSVSLSDAKVNQFAKLKFDFTGIFAGPTATTLATPTFNATVPPIFKGASFAIDSYAAIIDGLSIDVKNDVAKRVSVNAATGILEWFIKERMVSGKIAPEMVLPATKDFWTMWSGGSTYAMTATIGASAGNRCVITAPAVQLEKPKYGERESILTAEMGLVLTPTSAGNDEVIFTFN
jgi:hypothetical protein